MMKQLYSCGLYQYQLMIVGYTFTTKNGMVSLDCNMAGVSPTSSSHITIRSTAAKIQLPVRKIRLLGALICSQMDFNGTHNNGKDYLMSTETDHRLEWVLPLPVLETEINAPINTVMMIIIINK